MATWFFELQDKAKTFLEKEGYEIKGYCLYQMISRGRVIEGFNVLKNGELKHIEVHMIKTTRLMPIQIFELTILYAPWKP